MASLEMNIGQIPEIPMNPRNWSRSEVDKLARSLVETPELFEARPLLVYPHEGKFVILGGNLRYEASRANRSMRNRKIVKVHQNVLVFYKGDIANIGKFFPALDYRGEEYAGYFEEGDETDV